LGWMCLALGILNLGSVVFLTDNETNVLLQGIGLEIAAIALFLADSTDRRRD
jgi:hypothetical protein